MATMSVLLAGWQAGQVTGVAPGTLGAHARAVGAARVVGFGVAGVCAGGVERAVEGWNNGRGGVIEPGADYHGRLANGRAVQSD